MTAEPDDRRWTPTWCRSHARGVLLLLSLVAQSAIGCAAKQAYEGPKRPAAEIAIVEGIRDILFARNEEDATMRCFLEEDPALENPELRVESGR